MMEIKNNIWIVELSNEQRFVFDKEIDAINYWKQMANKEPKINSFEFTSEGVEYKQVSWEKIAMALARGELK